jgi:hypothetical protein
LAGDRLLELFKRFPNGRYLIKYKEAGSQQILVLFELNVDQGRLVPPNYQLMNEQGDPQEPQPEDDAQFAPDAPLDTVSEGAEAVGAAVGGTIAQSVGIDAAMERAVSAVPYEVATRASATGAAIFDSAVDSALDSAMTNNFGDDAASQSEFQQTVTHEAAAQHGADEFGSTGEASDTESDAADVWQQDEPALHMPALVGGAAVAAAGLVGACAYPAWQQRVEEAMQHNRGSHRKAARMCRRLRRELAPAQ